jgi:hypothetical protein
MLPERSLARLVKASNLICMNVARIKSKAASPWLMRHLAMPVQNA